MEVSRSINLSLGIIVIFLGGVVLRLAKPVLFPFFLAIFLSYILAPLLNLLKKFKVPKALSILLVLGVAFFIIYLLGTLFYTSGKSFASALPQYSQKVENFIASLETKLRMARLNWELVDWLNQFNLERVGKLVLASFGPFFAFISNLFLIFLFLVFILAENESFGAKIARALPQERSVMVLGVIQKINYQIQKYLAIKTLVSFITGALATVVLVLFGLEFAIVFGFLTFLLNYIPNIGSFIATAFPVAMAVFQYDNLWPAFWILVILITIQMVMGNFVEPRLMGEGLGLSPLVVILALFFWGWLWGIPGMILAVPITAIIKIVCSNIPSLKFLAVLMSKGGEGEAG
ncbi:MAG: AI-2E family transporter [Candidatus Aminicenantes bacterium]|nr:AI-2E family transporter [Candidatus Aminicenantes bacterium]